MDQPQLNNNFDFPRQISRLLDGEGDPRIVEFVRNIPEKHLPPTDPESPQARILNAARILFAEKGFEGASTREIAEMAGVNQAMIHYYFGNKKTIYKHTIISQFYTIFLMIASFMPVGLAPVEFISEFPLKMIENLRKHPYFRQIMLREIAGGGETLREIINDLGGQGPKGLLQLLSSVLSQGTEEGSLRAISPDTIIYFMLGLSYGSMVIETFFSIVAGIDFSDEEQWAHHRGNLKSILMHGLTEREGDR